jgi:MYXO-CTERM domain-containing protein
MTVFVPTEELAGSEWERMCFAMTARDFYGHETPDEVTPADTVCDTTPEYSPFGSLCAVATGHGSADGWPASIALALVALFRRRTHVTA